VSFEEAATVFGDPLALAIEYAVDPGRTLLLGTSDRLRVLLVVHVELADETIRLISARRATSHERGDMKKVSRPKEPSKASLREIPEVDFTAAKVRRNPYAARVAAEDIHVRPGRPRKGTETGPTEPRSIRFPAPFWKLLEARAKAQGLSLHSALRAAIIDWARRAS